MFRESSVVVRIARGAIRGVRATKHVAGRERVVVPAIRGVALHRRVGRRVDVVALGAVAVVIGHDPARILEPAVVVGQIDPAVRRDVLPAYDITLRARVSPPARAVRVGVEEGARPENAV